MIFTKIIYAFSFLLIVVNDFLVCKKEILFLTIDGPTDRVSEIGFLQPKIKVRTQVEQDFSSFFAKFLPDLKIFQSGAY